jgi:hypothetical protein
MQPHEIVVREMQGYRRPKVLDLLAESVGKPGKATHRPTHRQILTLN